MIGIKTADIYLHFPCITEDEADELDEFLEEENIEYEGATDIFINLLKENEQLKEELKYTVPIVEHNKIVSEKLKENEQLKNNWNELKNWLEELIKESGLEGIIQASIFNHVLEKMQELEGSND